MELHTQQRWFGMNLTKSRQWLRTRGPGEFSPFCCARVAVMAGFAEPASALRVVGVQAPGDKFTPRQRVVIGHGGRGILTHNTPRVALQDARAESLSVFLVISALPRASAADVAAALALEIVRSAQPAAINSLTAAVSALWQSQQSQQSQQLQGFSGLRHLHLVAQGPATSAAIPGNRMVLLRVAGFAGHARVGVGRDVRDGARVLLLGDLDTAN